jgi:ABC-type sugar transport system substrate-binding protein
VDDSSLDRSVPKSSSDEAAASCPLAAEDIAELSSPDDQERSDTPWWRRNPLKRWLGAVAPIALVVLVAAVTSYAWPSSRSDRRVVILLPGSVRFFEVELTAMRDEAAKRDLELEVLYADWSASKQVEQLRLVSDSRSTAHAIGLAPVDSTILARAISEFDSTRIPIITFTNTVGQRADGKFPGVVGFVGRDDRKAGQLLAGQIEKLGIANPRIVVVGGSPGTSPQRLRAEGFDEVAAKHPEWDVVESLWIQGWNLDRVSTELLNVLERHEVDVIAVQWADAAVVASRLITWLEMEETPIVSLEWTKVLKNEMVKGHVVSSTHFSIEEEGRRTIETIDRVLDGSETPEFVEISQTVVDRAMEPSIDAEW